MKTGDPRKGPSSVDGTILRLVVRGSFGSECCVSVSTVHLLDSTDLLGWTVEDLVLFEVRLGMG